MAQLTSLDHANEANETRQVPPLAAPLAAHLPSVADVERAVGHAIAVASTAMNDVNLERLGGTGGTDHVGVFVR